VKPAEDRLWLLEVDGAPAGFCRTGPARDEDLPAGSGEIYGLERALRLYERSGFRRDGARREWTQEGASAVEVRLRLAPETG
jgi:hypothetical protein